MSFTLAGGLMGLAFGLRHALEPDHIAAVGTFVATSASARSAARVGALWGAGHALSVLVFGGILLAVRGELSESLIGALEGAVGVMLILLGARALLQGRREQVAVPEASTHRWPPFAVGAAHGAAGTGAVTVLASAAVGGPGAGLLFLSLFAVGSALSMALLAGTLVVPMRRVAARVQIRGGLQLATGLLSVGIGVWWVWKVVA